jgi:hypothetical protein
MKKLLMKSVKEVLSVLEEHKSTPENAFDDINIRTSILQAERLLASLNQVSEKDLMAEEVKPEVKSKTNKIWGK